MSIFRTTPRRKQPFLLWLVLLVSISWAQDTLKNDDIVSNVADAILADLNGAAYYKDPGILKDFLRSKFKQVKDPSLFESVSKTLVKDWNTEQKLKKREPLIQFLKQKFSFKKNKKKYSRTRISDQLAALILEDLKGIGFFKDPQILANFLAVKFGPLKDPFLAIQSAEKIVLDFNEGKLNEPKVLAKYINLQFFILRKRTYFKKKTESRHEKIAKAILADFQQEGFFKDPEIFANFLEVKYGPLKKPAIAQEVAQAILTDLNGTTYYQDVPYLSYFLRQKFRYARK